MPVFGSSSTTGAGVCADAAETSATAAPVVKRKLRSAVMSGIHGEVCHNRGGERRMAPAPEHPIRPSCAIAPGASAGVAPIIAALKRPSPHCRFNFQLELDIAAVVQPHPITPARRTASSTRKARTLRPPDRGMPREHEKRGGEEAQRDPLPPASKCSSSSTPPTPDQAKITMARSAERLAMPVIISLVRRPSISFRMVPPAVLAAIRRIPMLARNRGVRAPDPE